MRKFNQIFPSYSLNIASRRHGIEHGQAHLMIRADDEERPYGLAHLGILLLFLIEHAQRHGQIARGIGNDGIWKIAGNIQAIGLDVIHPINMRVQSIHRVGQALGIALGKLRLMDSDATQLCGANGRKVRWMREEHNPAREEDMALISIQ